MSLCTENIAPDSLTGAIFAVEGVKDVCVVLNGPTGCKFYHSAISDSQYIRSLSFHPSEYSERFHFGQARIPSTFLDAHDYVFGSREKVSEILRVLAQKDYKLIAVINSPGAALIGDDVEHLLAGKNDGVARFALESTGYSGYFGTGYQNALIKVFDAIEPARRKPRKNAVNLLGLSIYQKHFENNRRALEDLLKDCGAEVIAAPGAGDDVETLKRIAEAALNVVVYPEYGRKIAEKLESDYGTPTLILDEGPPIGFDASEAFVRQVARFLGLDPKNAEDRIGRARARAYLTLARYSSLLGLPKGALFSIKAEASLACALTQWLCGYLGMIPAAISTLPDAESGFTEKLETWLDGIHCRDALQNPILETPTHIVFADGNTISGLKLSGQKCCGVEIALPTLGYLDVTEKTLLGERGALLLLEQILNGLRFVLN
ncbi:MAG: nitrogenase component 1 [Candidatus Accumulibacter sp.]|jgi:nitrogenase molybdenum-iron protein alpha/beta subunit|nr:nitrogenase component 1 [Accumulibacter sp.]